MKADAEEQAALSRARAALRGAMDEQGVYPAELARRLGITRQRIDQMFRGPCTMTLRTLIRAAYALGYEVHIELWPRQKAPR